MPDFNVNNLLAGGGGLTVLGALLWRFLSRTRLGVKEDGAQGRVLDSVLKAHDSKDIELERSRERERLTFQMLQREQQVVLELRGELIVAKGRIAQLEEHQEQQDQALRRLADALVRLQPDAKPWVSQWLAESGYPPLDTPSPPVDIPT